MARCICDYSFSQPCLFPGLLVFYRDPANDEHVTREQREYLANSGAVEQTSPSGAGTPLWYLLKQRKVIGLAIGFAAYNYCFYLLLTWLPSYFTGALHLSLHESVTYTAIPWLFATATDLIFGGWLVDWLVARNRNDSLMRQIVLVGGMVIGLALIGPIFTRTPLVAVFWISLSIGGLAASAPVAWSIPSLLAPPDAVAKVGGIMNFANQIAAIAAPIVTGYLIGSQNDFAHAFLAADCAIVVGVVGYALLLGRIERIPAEPSSTSA